MLDPAEAVTKYGDGAVPFPSLDLPLHWMLKSELSIETVLA